MANRIKEDEKNEKIIRGLLKLPANKKCINCNSLGPQYVCTNFSIFICTNCSGIHREFTHRVKSVSMAKFTSQEVTALQQGGNERAKEIFFKEWDQQRQSFPDSSNIERLRTFIKHVYVDRRYTGDRSVDRVPKGDREDAYERRKLETSHHSQSPSYNDAYDRRNGDRHSFSDRNDDKSSRHNFEERRNPGYVQGDHKRSPHHFEVVDDRRRDDKFGKGNQDMRSDDRRVSNGAANVDRRSPNHQKVMSVSSPPMVRPVRDILGENAPPLQVGEHPKSNGGRVAENPAVVQITTSSSSSASTSSGNPTEVKNITIASLIDFSADPGPTVAEPQRQFVPQPSTVPPVDGGNWASFDTVAEQKTAPIINSNSLESALAQLYNPGNVNPVSNISTMPSGDAHSFSETFGQWPAFQKSEPFPAAVTQTTLSQSIPHAVGQPAVPQVEPSLFSAASIQTAVPQTLPHGVSPSNQPLTSASVPSAMGHFTASAGQNSQVSAMPHVETSPLIPSQPESIEVKPSERKELAADIFSSIYQMGPTAVPGWQAQSHHGMVFGMQYPTTVVPAPSFPYPTKPANPFDASTEATLVHSSTYPSMAPLQGALPTASNHSTLLRNSSFGAPSSQWLPLQHLPNSLAAPGGYMSQVRSSMFQQTSGNVFQMGNQVTSNQTVDLGMLGVNQNLTGRYPQPGTTNSFAPQPGSSNSFAPAGGNPFG